MSKLLIESYIANPNQRMFRLNPNLRRTTAKWMRKAWGGGGAAKSGHGRGRSGLCFAAGKYGFGA